MQILQGKKILNPFIFFGFVMACCFFCFFSLFTYKAAAAEGDLAWVKTTSGIGYPNGGWIGLVFMPMSMTSDDTYLYIGGYGGYYTTPNVLQEWRIEKRRKNDGNLEWALAYSPNYGEGGASITGIASDNNYIYAVGYDAAPPDNTRWRIEKRNKSDGSLVNATVSDPGAGSGSGQGDHTSSIAISGSYLYIVGAQLSGASFYSRIEKRRISDLGLEWANVSHFGSETTAAGVAVDGSALYVTGTDGNWENPSVYVEKRSIVDGSIIWQSNNPTNFASAYSLVYNPVFGVDDEFIYVSGADPNPYTGNGGAQRIIEKRKKTDGSLAWTFSDDPTGGIDSVGTIAPPGPYFYVVGAKNMEWAAMFFGNDSWWYIEKRNKSDGSLVWNIDENPTSGYFSGSDNPNSMLLDTSGLYIAGTQGCSNSGNVTWRIEKRGAYAVSSYIDCGLRISNGSNVLAFACEPSGALTSQLRIYKNGTTYGVVLVDPSDPNASGVRIPTSSGVKALRKYP